MWWLILFFIGGILMGNQLKAHSTLIKGCSIFSEICVYCLLFILGYLVGTMPNIKSNILSLGTDAIILSLCAIAGSILLTLPLERYLR